MVEASNTDPYDSMSREEIKENLSALAERHLEARHTYRSLRVDASKELNIWQTSENGVALTVCTVKAAGLTVEDFKAFN